MSSFNVRCSVCFNFVYISNRRHLWIWGHVKYMGGFNAENFHRVQCSHNGNHKTKILQYKSHFEISYFQFQRKISPFPVARTFEICILLWVVNSPFTVDSYLFWLVQTRQIPISDVQILIIMEKFLHSAAWSENGTRPIESTDLCLWRKKNEKRWAFCVDKRCAYIGFSEISFNVEQNGKIPLWSILLYFSELYEYWIPSVSGDSEIHKTLFSDGEFSADLQILKLWKRNVISVNSIRYST